MQLQFFKKMQERNQHKNKKKVNGRWNRGQHNRFMNALEKYGRDWTKVQKVVKTRTITQVRSHAQKHFLKMSKQDIDALIGGDSVSFDDEKCLLKSNLDSTKVIKEIQYAQKYSHQQGETFEKIQSGNEKCPQQFFSLDTLGIFENSIKHQHEKPEIPKRSYFLQCLTSNFDYFKEGGNFISMALNSRSRNFNEKHLQIQSKRLGENY